nr:MAG TPA: hypothetical protein [Caudoviricetes sp.]
MHPIAQLWQLKLKQTEVLPCYRLNQQFLLLQL